MHIGDRLISEETAEAIVKKLEKRKLIVSTDSDGLSPSYKIKRSLVGVPQAYSEFARRPSAINRIKRLPLVKRVLDSVIPHRRRARLDRLRKEIEAAKVVD
jgi:hypothetical protein